jgi:hypothetical protein
MPRLLAARRSKLMKEMRELTEVLSARSANSTAIVLRFGLKSRRHSTLGCCTGSVRK